MDTECTRRLDPILAATNAAAPSKEYTPITVSKRPYLLGRILAAGAASLCFSLAVLAVGLSVAELAGVSARGWMRQWEEQRQSGDSRDWESAYARLSLAHGLNPLSADYSADLGRLMEWRAWHQLSAGDDGGPDRERAGRFYQQALGNRPSWGFAWAHYAENRLLAGYRDEEFRQALEKAMTLAPWEPVVQRKIAWMGMAAWDDLPPATRKSVEQSVRRTLTMESRFDDIVRLAVQYDWLNYLAPLMRSHRQSQALERVLESSNQP
jgi:hypothetical protein